MWHPALISTLVKLDFPLPLLKWIYSWSKGRTMSMHVGAAISRTINTFVDVPTDPFLAAMLFRLHIHLLPSFFLNLVCRLFVDDLAIAINGTLEKQAEVAMKILERYAVLYLLNTIYKRSNSFTTVENDNQLKYGRYSVCEFNHKKSSFITNKQRKSTNFFHNKPKTKAKDIYPRRNSERYSINTTKYSLSNLRHTHTPYNRAQLPLHYVTYRRENNQQRLSKQLSITTTTSNLTRSTINTGSESSVLVDQNRLLRTSSNRK
ncbi:unnamed protein product [Adineta steineri]|uniref:Reverse transcriptase domain-containing protein n=1 Tax=Adineta steineri TaxID=433720 RepID=A0A814U405_9BILA|nr:unnamed protein product [Adineta steineri]CAF3680676.1 unnamed protein product [Adineta steineri]